MSLHENVAQHRAGDGRFMSPPIWAPIGSGATSPITFRAARGVLGARRAQLEALIKPDDAIMFSEAVEGDGALVFAKACELGVEGIVSKRLGGAYWSGPCRNWLKVKNPAFVRA
jgi:hypothetical protein